MHADESGVVLEGDFMELSLFSGPAAVEFIFRWGHFLAGITWIGILYYFNFIQGEWFKETDGSHKTAAVQKLVPRALWWFRWGAMFTFLTGLIILIGKSHGPAGWDLFMSSYGIWILTGASMGIFMFLNVWLVIWPAQKKVIAKANGESVQGDMAILGAKAALASRTNTLFSIPMLFFMGAASHLPLNVAYEYNGWALFIALAVIIGGIELNAVVGKMQSVFASVKGVIVSGFALTAVLYLVIEAMV